MKRILVATDGSEHADRAIKFASELGEKFGAQLLILHVVPDIPLAADEKRLAEIEFAEEIRKFPGSGVPGAATSAELEMPTIVRQHQKTDSVLRTMIGDEILRCAKRDATRYGANSVETVSLTGQPAETIIETANAKQADAIVLGSRGLSTLGEIFLGSVSHKVNHLSKVSVITVK